MALTNTQYDEIMRSYQSRQIARQHLIDARYEEIAARTPRLAELDAAIAQAGIAEARRRIARPDAPAGTDANDRVSANTGHSAETDISTLTGRSAEAGDPAPMPEPTHAIASARIAALTKEKQKLLRSLGYPEDYLTPPYVCPDCRDTGYIGAARCHCFRQAAIDLVYAQANLAPVFERECFSNFSLDYYSKDLIEKGTGISSRAAAKNALEQCRRFVRDFDTSFQNIYLFGDTGVGKTFLSHCIAGELLGTGHSVLYFSAARLFDLLADQAFGRDTAANADSVLDCDLLILDDLGTELTNAFTLSRFFVCLNERLLHERSTLISSNLSLPNLLSLYSDRIFSRITSSFLVLHLFGKDIRVQQQL